MPQNSIPKLILALLLISLLSACASNSRVVPRGQSYSSVDYGRIIGSEEVTIGGTHTGIGAYVGSAAAIHDSTSHNFFGLVLRGLAGSLVGAVVEEAITRRPGVLYTVEMKRGRIIEVLSTNMELAQGDCVEVVHAGRRYTEISRASSNNCISRTSFRI